MSHASQPAHHHSRPWYQEKFMWMVVALPLLAVVASAVSVSLAFIHADTVINDDVRSDELSIRQDDQADLGAKQLNVKASISSEGSLWVIHLEPGRAPLPDQLILTIQDGKNAKNDQRLTFDRRIQHDYVGAKPHLLWNDEAESNPSHILKLEIAPLDRAWRLLAQWQDGQFNFNTRD